MTCEHVFFLDDPRCPKEEVIYGDQHFGLLNAVVIRVIPVNQGVLLGLGHHGHHHGRHRVHHSRVRAHRVRVRRHHPQVVARRRLPSPCTRRRLRPGCPSKHPAVSMVLDHCQVSPVTPPSGSITAPVIVSPTCGAIVRASVPSHRVTSPICSPASVTVMVTLMVSDNPSLSVALTITV